MYCSTCGNAVNQNLSYCNHCGAKVSGARTLSEASFNTLVGSILGIAIAGLGVIIGLMAVMKNVLDLSNEVIVPFIIASFVILISAESVFIWLLVSHSRKSKTPEVDAQFETNRLNQVEIKGLNKSTFEPIPTVTEDTTRNLQPVFRETKKQ
ncbi:MAG TPA: hypothetical protein VGC76_11310 [Pyrinomonadaceae bacterium]|jgi:hypothetical protein